MTQQKSYTTPFTKIILFKGSSASSLLCVDTPLADLKQPEKYRFKNTLKISLTKFFLIPLSVPSLS